MNVVFMKVIVELAFPCKTYETYKNLINFKSVLQEPSFMNTTLRSFTEGCYLRVTISDEAQFLTDLC